MISVTLISVTDRVLVPHFALPRVFLTCPRDRYHLLSRNCDQLKPGHDHLRHWWAVGDTDPTYCLTDALATGDGNLDLTELLITCSGL